MNLNDIITHISSFSDCHLLDHEGFFEAIEDSYGPEIAEAFEADERQKFFEEFKNIMENK